jgi:hypothetical protein
VCHYADRRFDKTKDEVALLICFLIVGVVNKSPRVVPKTTATTRSMIYLNDKSDHENCIQQNNPMKRIERIIFKM